MNHHLLTDLGQELLTHGPKSEKSLSDTASGIPNDHASLAVLAAILDLLNGIWDQLNDTEPQPEEHPIADGILEALEYHVNGPRVPVGSALRANFNLSPRAWKAIVRSGTKYVKDITEKLIKDQKNSGQATADEVMAWKRKMLGEPEPVEETALDSPP